MQLTDVYQTTNAPNILYRLMQERSKEQDDYVNISHRKLPSWNEHIAFIERQVYRYWWLIEEGGHFIGSMTVSWDNEIGIVLFSQFRGKGYGKAALELLMDAISPLPALPSERVGGWVANINPRNAASIHLFESLGFVHRQNTYVLETNG